MTGKMRGHSPEVVAAVVAHPMPEDHGQRGVIRDASAGKGEQREARKGPTAAQTEMDKQGESARSGPA